MGWNRPSQLFWPLALLAVAACSNPVAEVTDGGSGTTAGVGGTSAGTSGGTGSGGATTGGTGGASSGGATTGAGSGTSGGIGGSSGASGSSGGSNGGTTGGGLLGQPCVAQANGYDPCKIAGLVCMPSTTPGEGGWVCQLPGEFQGCFPQVGCANQDLTCVTVNTPICVHLCQASVDCPSLYTSCQTFGTNQVCYYNACMRSTTGTFGTCNAAGMNDGTCLPENFFGGLCLGGGTAAPGDLCMDHRTAMTTAADLCAPQSACLPLGQNGGGHCAPLCGLDAGPTCPNPTFCVPSGQGDWGYCF